MSRVPQHPEVSQWLLTSGDAPTWPTGPTPAPLPPLTGCTRLPLHLVTPTPTLLLQVEAVINAALKRDLHVFTAPLLILICVLVLLRWILPQPSSVWCLRRLHTSTSIFCSSGPAAASRPRPSLLSSRWEALTDRHWSAPAHWRCHCTGHTDSKWKLVTIGRV